MGLGLYQRLPAFLRGAVSRLRRQGHGPCPRAVPAAAPAAALGREDGVHPGDQAVHGHGRALRRAMPAAPGRPHGRAGGRRPPGDREGARPGLHLMRARRVFHAVDSHTEGMPTRVIVGGVGAIPGDTMFDRRRYFMTHLDGIRKALMYEPRGHSAMSGAILQAPSRPDADWGVIFIEVSGCLPMCGHGTIGVATVLVETGMVEVAEPETVVRLDTPAGLVEARVAVSGGRAEAVTIRNVPAFVHARDQVAMVEGLG